MPKGTEEQMSGRMDAMGSLAGPDSDAETASQDTDQGGETTPADETGETTGDSDNSTQDAGDVTSGPADGEAGTGDASREETSKEARRRVFGRFGRERRNVAALATQRDEMLRLAKPTMPDKEERLKWVYSELDRMYPPLNSGDAETGETVVAPTIVDTGVRHVHTSPPADSGQIQGLHQIPEDWPELPSNASLSSEVGWVQANRLRVVEERPGAATLVRLERAASPAPSLAALGWLETSIRSYAKFVDVAARASGTGDDEGAVMRRERMALEEVKALIDEMKDAGDIRCPECGAKV